MTRAKTHAPITFSVPRRSGVAGLNLQVLPQAVAFAGSRNGAVSHIAASALVEGFLRLGIGFLTGCAPGIDRCFRSAFAVNGDAAERSIVACAFDNRARRYSVGDIFAATVVPAGLTPAETNCR